MKLAGGRMRIYTQFRHFLRPHQLQHVLMEFFYYYPCRKHVILSPAKYKSASATGPASSHGVPSFDHCNMEIAWIMDLFTSFF